MTSADPRFVDITNELADAVAEAIPGWFDAVAVSRLGRPCAPAEWAPTIAETAERVAAEIRRLATVDIDEQRTTPLSSIRALSDVATPLVQAAGGQEVARDPNAVALHPDDLYDLTPGGFSDLGERVQHAGLTWGAAKAHLHLQRRRPQEGDR